LCLPLFSSVHDQRSELRRTFRAVYLPLLLTAGGVAVAGQGLAEPFFVHLLGPSYLASAAYFKPLAWNCVLNFANVVMMALFYAVNDFRTPVLTISATVLCDLALN